MNLDDLIDELDYNLQNNLRLNYNPVDDLNNNITFINNVLRIQIKNEGVIYTFINDYRELYEGINIDKSLVNPEVLSFMSININQWEKTGQLLYAFNLLKTVSLIYKNPSIEVPDYLQPLPFINEISEKINRIILIEDILDDEINAHISTLFQHYSILISIIPNNTILDIKTLSFINENIILWNKTKQIIFAYNVMNNINELLFTGSVSGPLLIPLISLN